jgi:hypothetical protein
VPTNQIGQVPSMTRASKVTPVIEATRRRNVRPMHPTVASSTWKSFD